MDEMEEIFENLNKNLSIIEVKALLAVLERNKEFQRNELDRLRKLDTETECFKKLMLKKETNIFRCSMCNSLFVPALNPIYTCCVCQQKICSNCVRSFKSPSEIYLCTICHIERLQKLKSGKWLQNKTGAEPQFLIAKFGSKLSDMESEIQSPEHSIYEISNSSTVHRRLGNLLTGVTKSTSDLDSIDNSGRSSPSSKTLTISNEFRYNIATNLRFKYQIKNTRFKEIPVSEDISNDVMSVNSTLTLSDVPFLDSNSAKEQRINGFNNTDIQDYNQIKDSSSGFQGISRSISQISFASYNSKVLSSNLIIHGEILIAITFLSKKSNLQLKICECRDLVVANQNGNITHLFVKLYLLPDKSSSSKRKTSKKKNTLNPVYNETVSYHFDSVSLKEKTVNVSVWNQSSSNSCTFIGETNIILSNVDFKNPWQMWLPLLMREKVPSLMSLIVYKGEILVGLRYVNGVSNTGEGSITANNSGNLIIFIKCGRNLGNSKSIPSPYIKCSLIHKNSQTSVRQTKVISATQNPIWNTEFNYEDIDKTELHNSEVKLTVLSKKKLSKSYQLGELILRQKCNEPNEVDCKEKDVLLWRRLLDCTNDNIIEEYLPLRSSID